MAEPGQIQFFPRSGGLIGRAPFAEASEVLARDKFKDETAQRGIARSRAVTGAGLRGQFMQLLGRKMKNGEELGSILSSPEAIELMSSPDFDPKELTKMVAELQEQNNKVTPLAAGTAAFQGGEIVATNPPTKVQEAEGLAKLALQGNEFAAAIDAVNALKAPEQKLEAIRQLERAGKLGPKGTPQSQALMNKLIAGLIKTGEFRDPSGKIIAKTLIDLSTGQSVAVGREVDQPPVTEGDPSQEPDGIAPGTTEGRPAPAPTSQLKDPTDFAFSAGVVEGFRRGVGGVVGQQFPDLSGAEAKKKAVAAKSIRFNASNLRTTLSRGRTTGTSDAQLKIIDDIIPKLSMLNNPKQMLIGGINLFDLATTVKRNAEAVLADDNRTGEVRGKAASDIVAADKALAPPLPTRDQMQKRLDDLEAGIGGAQTVTDAAGEALQTGISLTKKLTGREPSVSVREIRAMSLDQLLTLDEQRATSEQVFSKEQKAAMKARISELTGK